MAQKPSVLGMIEPIVNTIMGVETKDDAVKCKTLDLI